MRSTLTIASALLVLMSSWAHSAEFEAPVLLEAGGQAICTDTGHSAPFVYDFDADGKRDLLVGQFGGGRLRIYKNMGTNEQPLFGAVDWFKAGGELGTIPEG